MSHLRRNRANLSDTGRAVEAGQATVEFVLILPVIAITLLLVVQLGLVVRDSLVVQDLAREAARAAAVEPTLAAARQAVDNSNHRLRPEQLEVRLIGGAVVGELITANVSYQSSTSVPIVGLMIGDVPLSAEVTMRVEWQS